MRDNFYILKYISLLFIGWKLALLFITYFGLSTFPSYNGISQELYLPNPEINYWFRWTNWDGGHFRGIAQNGYLPFQTVFFPLYPLLIKLISLSGLDANWSGLLISHAALLVSLFLLYKLVLLDFNESVAKRAVFALLIFPTSFYLGALYSESLFLATTLAAFYFTRINKWGWATFFAAGSITTRLVGVSTLAGLMGEYLLKKVNKFRISIFWGTKLRKFLIYLLLISLTLKLILKLTFTLKLFLLTGLLDSFAQMINTFLFLSAALVVSEFLIKNINVQKLFKVNTLVLLLSLLPIPLYMLYQQIIFQNPFGFLTNEFNWQRHFTMPWEPLLSYVNYLGSVGVFQIGNAARVLTELLFFTGGVIGLIFSFYKLRPSYTIFYALGLILPTLSGTLIAMPRYLLTIFPIFILLGMIENEVLQKVGVILSILLLAVYSMLFMGWYWVT